MSTSPSPFTHGVASFDPVADGVLLWTRVPGASAVRWHVSSDAEATDVVAEGTASVPADADGCVAVDVDGLAPGTTYHYWFTYEGVLSPLGRTRTLPLGATDWARLAVVCCADPSIGPLRGYRSVAEDEVDLVLHLGDYVYEEAKGDQPVEPGHDCVTLEDYRLRHAATRSSPDLQALHLRHPMVFVWDDHDVADNAWRHGAKEHDEDEHGPWEERLAAAAQARQEWVPARLRDPDDRLAMWRSFEIGDLAELVVLDTRIPGRDEQAGDRPEAKPLRDPARSLLGAAQRRWAHERIRDASRSWCVLASQVTVSPLKLPIPAGRAVDPLMPGGYATVEDEVICTDEWDGYPAERTSLYEAIVARGGGTVITSGDVHSSWALEPVADPDGDDEQEAIAVEAVCPSISSTPMAQQLPSGWEELADQAGRVVRDQRWRDLEHHGYLRLDLRPHRVRADWFAVAPDDADAEPRLLASWAVERAGTPRWVEATPSVPQAAAADEVRRAGVELQSLPAPQAPPPGGRRRWPAVLALVAGVVLVVLGVRRWLAGRRSRSPLQVVAAVAGGTRAGLTGGRADRRWSVGRRSDGWLRSSVRPRPRRWRRRRAAASPAAMPRQARTAWCRLRDRLAAW